MADFEPSGDEGFGSRQLRFKRQGYLCSEAGNFLRKLRSYAVLGSSLRVAQTNKLPASPNDSQSFELAMCAANENHLPE